MSAPIAEIQPLAPGGTSDVVGDLWRTFSKPQENMVRGDLRGRNAAGKRMSTRPVQGIDQSIKVNCAVLAEEMRKLKG